MASAAYNLRLDKLERAAAFDFLQELGKKSSAIAQISETERDQLYIESGGNPLILSWTVSQLGLTVGRSKTAADAIIRLKEANRLHQLDGKNDPLAFIFRDIVDTLTPDEVQVLAALVPFSTPAKLSWLLPLTEMSDMAALDALDGLRDRALLVEDDVAGTWLLPPLTATYLRRVHPESVLASGSRLADHVYALVQTHHSSNRSAIEAEWLQVISGLDNMYKGGDRKLQKTCQLLQDFIDEYGHWAEAIFYYEAAAIQALSMGDFVEASHRITELCGFYVRLGQLDKVAAEVKRAKDYLDRASHATREDRNMVLAVQGYLHYHEGRYNEVIQVFSEVIREAGGSTVGGSRARMHMVWLGASLLKLDELSRAERVFREAREMATTSSDHDELARIDSMLAELAMGRFEWPKAETILRSVLDFMDQHNLFSRELHASTFNRLGKTLLEQRRPTEALPYLQEAVCEFENLRSPKLSQASEYMNICMDALDAIDQFSTSS